MYLHYDHDLNSRCHMENDFLLFTLLQDFARIIIRVIVQGQYAVAD